MFRRAAKSFHFSEGDGAYFSDESEVRGLIDQSLARFGRLYVLVNCAGVWQSKTLEEVTAADVRLHFEVNTLGTFCHGNLPAGRRPPHRVRATCTLTWLLQITKAITSC